MRWRTRCSTAGEWSMLWKAISSPVSMLSSFLGWRSPPRGRPDEAIRPPERRR